MKQHQLRSRKERRIKSAFYEKRYRNLGGDRELKTNLSAAPYNIDKTLKTLDETFNLHRTNCVTMLPIRSRDFLQHQHQRKPMATVECWISPPCSFASHVHLPITDTFLTFSIWKCQRVWWFDLLPCLASFNWNWSRKKSIGWGRNTRRAREKCLVSYAKKKKRRQKIVAVTMAGAEAREARKTGLLTQILLVQSPKKKRSPFFCDHQYFAQRRAFVNRLLNHPRTLFAALFRATSESCLR